MVANVSHKLNYPNPYEQANVQAIFEARGKSLITKGGSLRPKSGFWSLPQDHLERYIWASQFVKDKTVLDAGCGFGYGSSYLSNGLARSVIGIDSDKDAIDFATRNYHHPGLDFRLMDVTRITLEPNVFDIVISFEVIEHLIDAVGYLKSISEVLKPSGFFLFSTPNKEHTVQSYKNGRSTNPWHVKEYYPKELTAVVEEFFSIKGIFAEFCESNMDPNMQKLKVYTRDCRVPQLVRKLVPTSIKNIWLRAIGYTQIPENVEKLEEFRIEEVQGVDALDRRYPIQIFLCANRSSSSSNL